MTLYTSEVVAQHLDVTGSFGTKVLSGKSARVCITLWTR